MDIVSHGLWGGVAFGQKNKRLYWWSFFFGVAPDLFSFGIFTLANILGLVSGPDWSSGRPDPSAIPSYVYSLYDVTHSLIVFALIFGLVWALRRRPYMPMLAWALHILVDIPTHSSLFFPTPFLWPISSYNFQGISWGQPVVFIPNLILLAGCYFFWWIRVRNKKRTAH